MSDKDDDRIARLKELRDAGTITDEDFRAMVLDVLGDQQNEEEPTEPTMANPEEGSTEQQPSEGVKAAKGNKGDPKGRKRLVIILGSIAAVVVIAIVGFFVYRYATSPHKPDDMTTSVFNSGVMAVNVTRGYLNGTTSGDYAYQFTGYEHDAAQAHGTDSEADKDVIKDLQTLHRRLESHTQEWSDTGLRPGDDDAVREALGYLEHDLGYPGT